MAGFPKPKGFSSVRCNDLSRWPGSPILWLHPFGSEDNIRMSPRTPLSPTAFAVLVGLASAPKSGVEILDDLDKAGARILGPGSLYRLLREMGDKNWVDQVDAPPGTDGRLRAFRLTERGREVLDEDVARLGRMLDMPGVLIKPDGS